MFLSVLRLSAATPKEASVVCVIQCRMEDVANWRGLGNHRDLQDLKARSTKCMEMHQCRTQGCDLEKEVHQGGREGLAWRRLEELGL